MPAEMITMRKLKEILRLKYGCKLSHRKIATSLSISASVVSTYSNRAAQLGITSWPLDEMWTDSLLKQKFTQTRVKQKQHSLPGWSTVRDELRSKNLTLQLLWEEYVDQNPGGYYSYNHYCRLYKSWLKKQKLSMRQTHHAGEKLFVDYCGSTIDIIQPLTGIVRQAQIFVAVMGASNYTYSEATWSQELENWVMSHARAFEFFGGVPELVIPDNLKSGVSKACRYEPDLNPTYQQMAVHYDTVVVPARPYKPKDKAKVEVGVQIVERWILARLRHETFISLKQLNQRIKALLVDLNSRQMKKHPGSRQEQFERIDKPALKPLPSHSYIYTHVKTVKAHIDYHVEIDKHYYSVPYTLVKQKLEAHISGEQVRVYHQGELVATHPRSYLKGQHTTCELHMPPSHLKHHQWSPMRFERWAKKIGPATEQLIQQFLQSRKHPEQSYRVCLGLLSLSKKFTPSRLESACVRALATGLNRLAPIKNMLQKGLESQPLPTQQSEQLKNINHPNIRGSQYYH